MKLTCYFLSALLLPGALLAQDEIPLLRPEERQVVDEQADEFNRAVLPVLSAAAKSTVRVWSGTRRMAYGTVVGDGSRVITKWSEVAQAPKGLRVEAGGMELRAVKVTKVFSEEDLAVLEVIGKPLTPVSWSFETPKLGSFLIATQPDGRPAAFGVVSVLERNLRDTDQAYLGVTAQEGYKGPGVKIKEVAPDSGAAEAGLAAGQVILKVGERKISGLLELKNALTGVAPGGKISLLVDSGSAEKMVDVLLGNRPKLQQFSGMRLQQMERMGGPISEVRDSFTRVLQTDMRSKPNQIGGPVVNLKGEVLGITVARADRTRSFVMPAAALVDLLKKDGEDPQVAQVREAAEPEAPMPARGQSQPRGRMIPGGEERMRRHLSDMQRLMDHMRGEMEGIEESR